MKKVKAPKTTMLLGSRRKVIPLGKNGVYNILLRVGQEVKFTVLIVEHYNVYRAWVHELENGFTMRQAYDFRGVIELVEKGLIEHLTETATVCGYKLKKL